MTTETAISPKIAAGLAIDRQALRYQVEYTPEEAAELVAHLGDYNEATHNVLAGVLRAIDNLVPLMDFGGDNPNNGRPFHTYRIGREYSRVLYVDIIGTYIHKTYGWTADDWAELAAGLLRVGRHAEADECTTEIYGDITETGKLTLRLWWD